MKDAKKLQEIAVGALAVIGLIVVLALGSFATISIIKFLPQGISYLGSAAVSLSSIFVPGEKMHVALAPEDIESGKATIITWEHVSKGENGSYTLNYPCASGVSLKTSIESRSIICDVPYPFSGNTLSIAVTSLKNHSVDVPLTVSFTREGETVPSLSGSKILTIKNNSIAEVGSGNGTTNNGGTGTLQPGQKTEKVYAMTPGQKTLTPEDPLGKPDLKPFIIETGSVDPITNVFTASSSVRLGQRAAVRFIVSNIGTKSSGAWTFAASIPTFPSQLFDSETQPSLSPGDRVEFTLGFDAIYENGDRQFTINVDPIGSVREASEDNNIARTIFTVFLK